ncbi:MAG: VIT and VWA domain-containing protein, partial [Planctomycetota bacterium]|nr:VIT and VWA domain-containing protein [Planctomycetota bacterium]
MATKKAEKDGNGIALQSVHIEGALDGLLLTAAIRQKYRHDGQKNQEMVYTFPLAWGAVLLGLEADIAGKRMRGVVAEKKEAEEKYEKAIDEGDTPIMVAESTCGLYTANLGNIQGGDEVTVEVRYAQLLRFEQGRIRLCLPTVVAPRYGDPHGRGGLAPHESAGVDPGVEYPLTLKLDLLGQVAQGEIASPSHKIEIKARENGLSVLLTTGAKLDRDFILTLGKLTGASFALAAPDGQEHLLLASFCPALPIQEAPQRLKILVDCSGSMAGDSIESAKQALRAISRELKAKDQISYSRFGTQCRHEWKRFQACSPKTILALNAAIDNTQADMGGTKLGEALLQTLAHPAAPEGNYPPPSLLLITDGEVWGVEDIIKQSFNSGQRIFAIGVGSAPAESLLRDLAEKTGGACELVSPNEDMKEAVLRMFKRMRGAGAGKIRIDWGAEPLWQTPAPIRIYADETLHQFASFAQKPAQPPVLSWEVEDQARSARAESVSQSTNPDLARLGGARRMAMADSPETALQLALKYQLVSQQSVLFLVHERESKAG